MPASDPLDVATLKSLFGKRSGKKRAEEEPLSVDDLIVLERYEEAEQQLRKRLKSRSQDLRSQLKLADVYMKSGRRTQGVEEYIAVADGYSREGFYDKAIALLAKVSRLLPGDAKLEARMERLRRAKKLEHRRSTVTNALLKTGDDRPRGTSAFELQQLWQNLSASHLVEQLDEDQLSRLFGLFDFLRFESGAEVVAKGQRLDEIYLVAGGEVEAVMELPNGTTTVIRAVEAGDLFGEHALFERRPWPLAYRASKKTTLLKLDRAALERAMMGNPDPRGLIEALRAQRLDAEVAVAVGRLNRD